MPIVEYMLLKCPIRAPHPQMERSDWTLLTTSVLPLASSDMYVAIGQVQEYSEYAKQCFIISLKLLLVQFSILFKMEIFLNLVA
jgi:hypothetical protein